MPEGYLSVTEAAERAGVLPQTIRHAISDGRLDATRFGRDWFIELVEIDAYIAQRQSWKHRKGTTPKETQP